MSELIIDKITTRDGSNVGAIVVADIDELLLLNTNKEINTTAIVKDNNRGGVFIYDATQSGVNNGGTIFNGWVRQYDGAVNVKWFQNDDGTPVMGDGINDDTTGIQSAFSLCNASTKENYTLDFGAFTYIYNLLQGSLVITRNNVLIKGKAQIRVKVGTYDVADTHKTYTLFKTAEGISNVTLQELTMDCNNQASDFVYPGENTTFTEMRFVRFNGTSLNVGSNNKALNLRYTNGNGQVAVGNHQKASIFSGIVSEIGNMGIGFNESDSCIIENCYCKDARDASFAAWYNSKNIIIVNNTVNTNTNGNGIDISGSSACIVQGNTVRNCRNSGIWVGKDPNGGYVSEDITISNNTLNGNCQYSPNKGEIRVASHIAIDSGLLYDSDLNAKKVLITGNMITATINNDIYINDAENVCITSNLFTGTNVLHILWNTSNHVEIRHNSLTHGGYYEFQNTESEGSALIEDFDASQSYLPIRIINNGLRLISSNLSFRQKLNLSETLGKITFTTNGYMEVEVAISHTDQSGYSRKSMIFKRHNGTVTNVYNTYDHYLPDAVTGWEPEITYTIDGNIVVFTTSVENAKDGWFVFNTKGNNAYFSKNNTI